MFIFVQLALASNPISNCGASRAVPFTMPASGGACGIPLIGIPVANSDETFFSGGAKCGACIEVTGPSGTTVVQIVDKCDKGTGTNTCTGDVTQFGLDEQNAYNKIIDNRDLTNIIYDLGYREVTCPVTGNLKIKVSDASDTYFKLDIWNFRAAIHDVRLKSEGSSVYDQLTRQGTSGVWQWNKRNNNIRFPVTLYVVGSTDELITTTFQSKFPSGEADFGKQFTQVVASNGLCPMASSPAAVYIDSVGYGWNNDNSFKAQLVNKADTTNPYAGTNAIHTQLWFTGGLLFTRLGGFNPLYFSYLTFAARASNNAELKIYLGDGTGPLSTTRTITQQWTVYNISVTELTTAEVETALVFLNLNNGDVMDFWFDSITWELAAKKPGDDITPVTTGGYDFVDSTTGTVVIVDTTSDTTTGFSFGDSSDDSSAASSAALSFFLGSFVVLSLLF